MNQASDEPADTVVTDDPDELRATPEEASMNPAPPVPPEQREILGQALADAVYYRDPPAQCRACEKVDRLCDDCAAGLARASAYLALGRKLGIEIPQ